MDDDEGFADTIKKMISEINMGKLQTNTTVIQGDQSNVIKTGDNQGKRKKKGYIKW